MSLNRIKLIVIDIVERMNEWEELTICKPYDGIILYQGSPDNIPPSIYNAEVTGIGISAETVLLYINQ